MFTKSVTQFSSGYGGAGGGGLGFVVLFSSWWWTYRSSFGDESPMLVNAPFVAASSKAEVTWSGVGNGFAVLLVSEAAVADTAPHTDSPSPLPSPTADERYAAAAPATCGHAIEVPLIVRVASSSPIHALFTFEPGAKISTHEP